MPFVYNILINTRSSQNTRTPYYDLYLLEHFYSCLWLDSFFTGAMDVLRATFLGQ